MSDEPPLMLLGAGGLCIVYALLGACYYMGVTGVGMIVLVVLAIGCYAMTLGPCTWVLISEIFPDKIRSVGVATCTFALWVGSSTLTYTFPFLNRSLGSYGTFWVYAVVCAVGFALKLKETKGKTLEYTPSATGGSWPRPTCPPRISTKNSPMWSCPPTPTATRTPSPALPWPWAATSGVAAPSAHLPLSRIEPHL